MIAVTGSSGKTSTVALLGHILSGWRKTHTQEVENTFVPVANSIASAARDSEFLVFEAGATNGGSVNKLSTLLKPDVAVVTMVNLEHYKAFGTLEAVAQEKASLVRALKPGGLAVLNADDPLTAAMADITAARVVTFGESQNADYRVSEVEFTFPGPLGLTISSKHGVWRLRLPFVGAHFWVSAAAAFAVAAELGAPIETVAARAADFEPVEGRSQLIDLENGISFLLDTAKAPWHSFETSLKPLETVTGRRRIAIIGQISDYRGASESKYRKAYKLARAVSEITIFAGENAHKSNPAKDDINSGRSLVFADINALKQYLRANLKRGDFVFIKSSNVLHLERLALDFQHDVRCWIEKCRLSIGCAACGLYKFPYEAHPAIRRKNRFSHRLKLKVSGWLSGSQSSTTH